MNRKAVYYPKKRIWLMPGSEAYSLYHDKKADPANKKLDKLLDLCSKAKRKLEE